MQMGCEAGMNKDAIRKRNPARAKTLEMAEWRKDQLSASQFQFQLSPSNLPALANFRAFRHPDHPRPRCFTHIILQPSTTPWPSTLCSWESPHSSRSSAAVDQRQSPKYIRSFF